MRIKEVNITRYGPLNRRYSFREGLNLLYGPNESGKTLLVEALMKKLLGIKSVSEGTERVEESPEGFVVVEDQDEEHKLEDETLQQLYEKVYGYGVSSDELRNIVFIRNSDLEITEEDRFYNRITDKITGNRIADIKTTKESLIERGRLTPTELDISNSKGYGKPKDQLETARCLKEEIGKYLDQAREKNLDQTEKEVFRKKAKLEQQIEEQIERLEKARKKKHYEKILNLKNDLKGKIQDLEEIPIDRVRELENSLNGLEKEEIIQDCKERSKKYSRWTTGLIVGSLLGIGSIFFSSMEIVSAIITVLFTFGAFYTYYQWHNKRQTVRNYKSQKGQILESAQNQGIETEDIGGLRTEIATIEDDFETIDRERNRLVGSLSTKIDSSSQNVEKLLDRAEEKLEELKRVVDFSVEKSFSKEELQNLEGKQEELNEKVETLQKELSAHDEKIEGIGSKAQGLDFLKFTGEELALKIENLEALEKLEGRLQDFIQAIEKRAELSRKAISVFEEIEDTEKEKTADLFSEENSAARIFAKITDQRYTSVGYNPESNLIEVERSSGEVNNSRQLSHGAYDQLYLAIRIYLGKKILDGSAGFFIMDDPFLASDIDRLKQQVTVLQDLVSDGWQVIYLTSQEDAKSAIGKVIEGEAMEMTPI